MESPTVVTGYEGRPQSRDALVLARLLAEAWDARVLAVWVPDPDEPYSTRTHEALRERIRRAHRLRTEAAGVLDGGPEWELTTQAALWPADGLGEVSAEQGARAVVVGSSHLGAMGRILLGSTAARLLKRAPCPVAVAPRGWAQGRSVPAVAGVGLAGSPASEQAHGTAAALCTAVGARLTPLAIETHHAADALAEASRELDLLVMGLSEHANGLSRRLSEIAACPLLVVPEAPASRPPSPSESS